jgi:hypothetical protein
MKPIQIYLVCLSVFFFLMSGCATTKPEVQEQSFTFAETSEEQKEVTEEQKPKSEEEPSLEEKWGIRILSIRQSANGYMLDFRYRVIDPEKASLLLSRKEKPYLIDQASGARFMVPSSPKIGPLRQTALKPIADRNYFILFANPGKYVKPGNKVTVVIGEFRAENLVVE